MSEVLYNSAAIVKKIHQLFNASPNSDRRVALVAYIGQDYADYLPNPRGIDVICNPTPGATSVVAVDGLCKSGATVRFSDKLHMKVYWSESCGCVITSANLSRNAFGVLGLKEAGVWLEPNSVDIDQLIMEAQPYAITPSRIKRLRVGEGRYERAMAQIGRRYPDDGFQYLDWLALSTVARKTWKLGDWDEQTVLAKASKARLKNEFNQNNAHNYLNIAKKDSVVEGDWLLQYRYDYENGEVIDGIDWMFVHFVVPFEINRGSPFQAVQVYPTRNYGRSPFPLTAQFKKAFRNAVSQLKKKSFDAEGSMSPSALLLKKIAANLNRVR